MVEGDNTNGLQEGKPEYNTENWTYGDEAAQVNQYRWQDSLPELHCDIKVAHR